MIKQGNVLMTGGSGLLGGEIKKLMPQAMYPSSSEFDITDYKRMNDYISGKDIEVMLHAAAFTSPPLIDKDPKKAIDVNIIGTSNVVLLCMEKDIKLIYISTDYVFKGDKGNYRENDTVYPVNKYAWSKLGGECSVRMYDNSLIIRTSFGPNVFPFEKAFVDQWTSRESVKTIAEKIVSIINNDVTGTLHIGGNRKTVFEYAKSLDESKDIKELYINEVSFIVPVDTSLDSSRYKEIIEK